MRPNFITEEDIVRWSNNIDNDPNIPQGLIKLALIREVCYAGLWLAEKLQKLGCSDVDITAIQFIGGKISFGRDPWEVHQTLLGDYKKQNVIAELDHENIN